MAFYNRSIPFDIRPDRHRRLVGIGIYIRGMVDVSPMNGVIGHSGAGIYAGMHGNAAVNGIRIYRRPYGDALVNDVRRRRSSRIYGRTDCDDVGGRRSIGIYVRTYDYVAVNDGDF